MRVAHLYVRNFRCFDELDIHPRDHVGLLGVPGVGRTALLDALSLALDPHSTRGAAIEDNDFHRGRLDDPIDIQVTLADLGEPLTQHFMLRTEPWDASRGQVLTELRASLSQTKHQRVLRIGYRAAWSAHDERVEQRVYYVKSANPNVNYFQSLAQRDRELLPFTRIGYSGAALSLRDRSDFRRLVDTAQADDLHGVLIEVQRVLADASNLIAESDQVSQALEQTIEDVESLIPLEGDNADVIRLVPGGTTIAGLLRSLVPELHTTDGVLPLDRTGATNSAILRVAQSLALMRHDDAVVAVDDFGEQLDGAAASYLFGLILRRADQAWVSTRRTDVAQSFSPDDVLRLHVAAGRRNAAQLPPQRQLDRSARVTLKHLSPQLLRAATGNCVVIVEGPDDVNSIEALSKRVIVGEVGTGISATRSTVIHPGLMQESSGHNATVRLATAAGLLALRTVIVLDGDTSDADITAAINSATAVVRLPDGFAIERTLLHGINTSVAEDVLNSLIDAFGLSVVVDSANLDRAGRQVLKAKGKGLHATFIDSLPITDLPRLGVKLIETLVKASNDHDGLMQMSVSS